MNKKYEKCIELKKYLDKCLKLNIQVFGKENGVVMCDQLQHMFSKYCIDQYFNDQCFNDQYFNDQ
jgi:hypothetical protein